MPCTDAVHVLEYVDPRCYPLGAPTGRAPTGTGGSCYRRGVGLMLLRVHRDYLLIPVLATGTCSTRIRMYSYTSTSRSLLLHLY